MQDPGHQATVSKLEKKKGLQSRTSASSLKHQGKNQQIKPKVSRKKEIIKNKLETNEEEIRSE